MSYTHYDRLSALDASFLELEDANVHMHIGSIALFDAGPLRTEAGGIDMERILAFADAALRRRPRFLQKISYVPAIGHPVWIDDDKFNLRYHVRHTCLPAPGEIRALKRLAGRIMSQQLDRGKPLWELWFVEGIEGDRFAVISKVHHCLADGVAGVDLVSAMMGTNPDYRLTPAGEWIPRPAPSGRRLMLGELWRRVSLPVKLLRSGGRVLAGAADRHASVRDAVEGIAQAAISSLQPADETPFNASLGPHRRFDWARVDLEAAKEVKNRLGGKLNDVVLATVAGAIRRFLLRRGMRVDGVDFRVIVPVNVRGRGDKKAAGNRVSSLVARLPIDEENPLERYRRVEETTRGLKGSKQSLGAETLAEIADLTFSGLMTRVARVGLWSRAANIIVTNVPGARVPIYLLGARLLEVYPVVPLGINQGLGIALLSYEDGLYWGLNSDWDAVPDLHDLVKAIHVEFDALCKAAADAPADALDE